jgi:hypothetical protein
VNAGGQLERQNDGVWRWKKSDGTEISIATIGNTPAKFLKIYDGAEAEHPWKRAQGGHGQAHMKGGSAHDADFLLQAIQRIDNAGENQPAVSGLSIPVSTTGGDQFKQASNGENVVSPAETAEVDDLNERAKEVEQEAGHVSVLVDTAKAENSHKPLPGVKLNFSRPATRSFDTPSTEDEAAPEPTAEVAVALFRSLPRQELIKAIQMLDEEFNGKHTLFTRREGKLMQYRSSISICRNEAQACPSWKQS